MYAKALSQQGRGLGEGSGLQGLDGNVTFGLRCNGTGGGMGGGGGGEIRDLVIQGDRPDRP